MDLVYKKEKTLFALMLGLSLLAWAALAASAGVTVLGYAVMFLLFYCFAQSALISYIKGTGVRITHEQFPDLHAQIGHCCAKLGLAQEPEAYLLQMGGTLNAFATRFLGRDFLVLYSDVVDNLHDNPDALNFYIGHEIGHIKRRHLSWGAVLMPAAMLPLLGAAYARAREYTCDRHGLAACAHPLNAELGMAALAAGGKRWRTMNTAAFVDQARATGGFWMSFHELVGDYPWLVKRMAALRALAAGQEVRQARRHPLAAILALFVPRIGGGVFSGAIAAIAISIIVTVAAVQGYQQYQDKVVSSAHLLGILATTKIGAYMAEHGEVPTLAQAGVPPVASDGDVRALEIDPESGVLRVVTSIDGTRGQGVLIFEPSMDEDKEVRWTCSGEGIMTEALPEDCR